MSEIPVEEAQQTFTIMDQSMRGKPWRVSVFRDSVRFESTDFESFEVSRVSASEQMDLVKSFTGAVFLTVRAKKRLTFRLDAPQRAAIEQWLGPPTRRDLEAALKKRFSWGLILGIVFIFGSIPMQGDPERGIKDIPFDPLSLLLGVVLIALRFVSKRWPSGSLFLVDSIWFLVLGIKSVYSLTQGSSWLWGFIPVACLWASYSSLRLYSRFKTVQA